MQTNLHPTWHHDCVVTCACGNKFTTGSSQKSIQVDICSQCHPFFTGEMKFVDRQGRVDKFRQKMQAAQVAKKAKSTSQKQKAKKADPADTADPKSYREILQEQQTQLRQAGKTQ